MRVVLENEDGAVSMSTRGAVSQWRTIRSLTERSSRGDILDWRLSRPHPDTLRAAILAWSFAEWSRYAGYGWAASPGAGVVRRVLLDGSIALPYAGVIFFDNALEQPIGTPHPVVVVQSDGPVDIRSASTEFLGLGVMWGDKIVGVLPAANDGAGLVYERVQAYHEAGRRIRYVNLRKVMRSAGFARLDQVLRIRDNVRLTDFFVTQGLSPEDSAALLRDEHPERVDPSVGKPRAYPDGLVREFRAIEDVEARVPIPQIDKPRGLVRQPRGRLVQAICVREVRSHLWHIATHVRGPREAPREFVVLCGRDTPFGTADRRALNGAGLDGRGFVCGECTHLLGTKSIAQRRAEGDLTLGRPEVDSSTGKE